MEEETCFDPRIMTIAAAVLLALGVLLPLLMVIKVIPPSFILCFVSYISIVLGSMLGYIGTTVIGVQNARHSH